MPVVAPDSRTQGIPAQQSAPVEQRPPSLTQTSPHTNAGDEPLGLGTQARPQQSALLAQGCPALEPASGAQPPGLIMHRGMPSTSSWQVSCCSALPAQQSAVAEQAIAWRRQREPAGEHFLPWSQRPRAAPGALAQ